MKLGKSLKENNEDAKNLDQVLDRSHFRANITLVLMHSGIVNGHQLT